MKIELISTNPPCQRCRNLYETLQELTRKYTTIELSKDSLDQRLEYINYPTPVIIIDGEVVSIGKAPGEAVLERLITARLNAGAQPTRPAPRQLEAACTCD